MKVSRSYEWVKRLYFEIRTEFCCEELKATVEQRGILQSSNNGELCVPLKESYEYSPIFNFCPFCGKRIKYCDIKKKQEQTKEER